MNVEILSLKRPQGLFLTAAILRLVLFYAFPGLPELVAGRVEVSTPVNSFKRCTCPNRTGEAVFSNVARSTRRTLSLQPQCIALRWRSLPPSAIAATALFPPAEFRFDSVTHVPPIYRGGSTERECSYNNRGIRGSRVNPAVQLAAQEQKMERSGGRFAVSLHLASCY